MKIGGELRSGRIFYGWWVVLVAATGLFLSYIPVVSFTFGVFSKPLIEEFNWGRTETALAFSFSLIGMCAAMPLMGWLVDRFGARKVIVPCVLILGLSLISFFALSNSLWHFYSIYIVMGIVGGGTAPVPYSGVISHWFDKQRGLALSLAAAGAGLGSLVVPLLAQALMAAVGWRQAYVVLGFTVIIVTVPLVGLFLKETPKMMGLLPDGEVAETGMEQQDKPRTGLSRRKAVQTGTFWIICTTFFLVAASFVGCLIHLVPMLTDRGLTPQRAALAVALFGGASLLGSVLSGALLDRFFAPYVAVCFFGAGGLGVLFLWSNVVGGLALLAACLVGLGMGSGGQIIPYLVSRYFGLRAFGEIYSYAVISFTSGAAVGPLVMGISFDSTGSYRPVLGVFLVGTLTAAALLMRLGEYAKWERVLVEPTTA